MGLSLPSAAMGLFRCGLSQVGWQSSPVDAWALHQLVIVCGLLAQSMVTREEMIEAEEELPGSRLPGATVIELRPTRGQNRIRKSVLRWGIAATEASTGRGAERISRTQGAKALTRAGHRGATENTAGT
jgi:hypothetical protein